MSPELKKFSDLAVSDFERYPVWVNCHVGDYDEPWYEDTDEETFRPWTGRLPVEPDTMYLVSATMQLADGSQLVGFATPMSDDQPLPRSLGTMQPELFSTSGERVSFWLGISTSREYIDSAYRVLGKGPAEIFPIAFRAIPGLSGGICAGDIPGFCSIPKGLNGPVTVEQ
jgi:hypothetical protein